MTEENVDVNQNDSQTAQVQEQAETTTDDSQVVKTEVVDKNVYEKVREAMQKEREAKKAEQAKNAELEARLAKLEQSRNTDDYTDYDPYKAKTDILFLMNKDPFVKENLDLIEEKMTTNPEMDVKSAIREVKSDFFDRIQSEVSTVEVKQPKQEKPTAEQEQVEQRRTGNVLNDALAGKYENMDPAQLAAIKRVLGK